ncbi:winged helix-turn-helix transcriptional regulator [Natrialbaceae archaeon GCM10025810]|uniref:winged helix-turn-helix transcriptional regulator n=1 Tax=Halovalidus salilacus TaxID=3075124 RepID=UPI0036203F03
MPTEPQPDDIDWEFKDRDIKILRELAADPQISSRELADVLEEKYDIDVSNVTVSETIRKMRESGIFHEAILPNEEFYNFALFEFKFFPWGFSDNWKEAMEHIMNDEHTMMYFISNGEYQWKTIMMFRTREAESKWIHDFYREYGDVVLNVRNSVAHNMLKFRTDPKIFELLDES